MDKRIGLFAGLTALLAMGSAQAATCPDTLVANLQARSLGYIENPDTGHIVELFKFPSISWDEAKACVELLPTVGPDSTAKHLATITSSRENDFIVRELLDVKKSQLDGKTQVWVGGSQAECTPEPGCGWRWENGEGSFPGVNTGTVYANWATNGTTQIEPNNTGGIEKNLTVGRFPDDLYVWNDEGSAPSSIGGFIVEYDTPRIASECTGDSGSTEACTTIEGQTLTFPAGTFEPGDKISFSAYEFRDPRVDNDGKCTVTVPPGGAVNSTGGLTLFKADDGYVAGSELRIPAYLCGSPNFVVVKVDSAGITIPKGTVFVENTPETPLPANLYRCFDPILGNLAVNTPNAPDPQYQDVVVWQTTDPTKMSEDSIITSIGIYDGAATEATNGCGSTTAKVRGASYFVVGMHIDFGNDGDYPALQNYENFVALTKYKLSVLQKSVDESKTAGSVKKPDWQAMSSQLKNAISKLYAGDPAGALTSMQQFVFKVNSSTYGVTSGFNYNGDHLMRGENIVFMLRVKIIPYKPVP